MDEKLARNDYELASNGVCKMFGSSYIYVIYTFRAQKKKPKPSPLGVRPMIDARVSFPHIVQTLRIIEVFVVANNSDVGLGNCFLYAPQIRTSNPCWHKFDAAVRVCSTQSATRCMCGWWRPTEYILRAPRTRKQMTRGGATERSAPRQTVDLGVGLLIVASRVRVMPIEKDVSDELHIGRQDQTKKK